MSPEVRTFWEEVRASLRPEYGQDAGKRDRTKASRREQLAHELRLSPLTLKGFINGHQLGLGREALLPLFTRFPALKDRYQVAAGRADQPSSSPNPRESGGLDPWIQLTLQFEGFDDSPRSFTTRIPPRGQGAVILRIDSGRVA
jgi:hypothetical protein